MAYSSLKDYFKLYKIYCKIKTENFHEIFNCPVRQIFGKIVLLDRRPTRQIRLYNTDDWKLLKVTGTCRPQV